MRSTGNAQRTRRKTDPAITRLPGGSRWRLRNYGQGADVTAMACDLAGPGAGFVTGASLTADGGFLA